MSMAGRAKVALRKQSGFPHDANGYVADARLNLVAGVTAEMIKLDYCGGADKNGWGNSRPFIPRLPWQQTHLAGGSASLPRIISMQMSTPCFKERR